MSRRRPSPTRHSFTLPFPSLILNLSLTFNLPKKYIHNSFILSIYAAVCAGSSACKKPWAYLARLGWFSCGLCVGVRGTWE